MKPNQPIKKRKPKSSTNSNLELDPKKKVIVLFTTFMLTFFAFSFVYGDIPTSERAALIALYNSTNGDNWTKNTGWKIPPLHTDGFAMPGTEDSWHGVKVEGDTVTSINLYDNQLTGNIPPELGNLLNLKRLFLYKNQLTGSIPSELGNLSNLR